MKALMELNRDDIRDIIALHFGVDESAVTVSRRATVRVSGDVPVKNAVKATEGGRETTAALPEGEAEERPQEPEAEAQAAEEPKKRASRVERLFGKREEWPNADEEPSVREVKGFMLIKCSACGDARSFFLKDYTTTCNCAACGAEIPLDGNLLKPVYAKCPACENALKYKTNFTGDRLTLACKRCGGPIDCELNGKRNAYTTIK